jgi:ferredoxin
VTVAVDARCTACGACILTCPEHALLPAPRRPEVRDDRCTDCLACVEICPTGAITPAGAPLAPPPARAPLAPPPARAPLAPPPALLARRPGRPR